jgi:hypothetical protein
MSRIWIVPFEPLGRSRSVRETYGKTPSKSL